MLCSMTALDCEEESDAKFYTIEEIKQFTEDYLEVLIQFAIFRKII